MQHLIRIFILAATVGLAWPAMAQEEPSTQPEAEPAAEAEGEATEADDEAAQADDGEYMMQVMFVQNAHNITYADGKLTLERISPTTIFFADRPDRIVGHMTNDEFVVLWNEEGENNFVVDPPNAVLSIFGDEEIVDVVVVLENPTIDGHSFSYDVTVLDGELPPEGAATALFIDPVGMPATPGSAAGVHRRHRRRRAAAIH